MDIPFIRNDLSQTTEGAPQTFFRLDDGLHEFLVKLEEKHEIEAILLTRNEDGSISRNIGFVIKEN